MKLLSNFGAAQLIIVLLLAVPRNMYAQSSTTPSAQSNPPAAAERPDTGVYSGRDVYVPKISDKKDPEPAATSFADGFLRNTKQHIGASVGLTETYTPNIPVSNGTSSVYLASIFPQVFVNLEKKKLRFRFNYGLAYERIREASSQLNSASQNGSATLSYNLSGRKATLGFSNSVTSMYYDEGSFLGMYLTTPYLNGSDLNISQLYPDRARLSRGTSGVNFSYRATKKSSFSAGLSYDVARYTGSYPYRGELLSGIVGASYSVKKWLSLTTGYSQSLYTVGQTVGNANVQNLQIGGLSFKLGRGWTISGSGGLASTKTYGVRSFAGSGTASVSKKGRRTTIDLSYNRGYSSAFPASTVWSGDTANIYILHHLLPYINVHANSAYLRGLGLGTTSVAHSAYGSAGLDFLPRSNLVISTNYFLVSQKVLDVSFQQPSLHRFTITAGITYYLPSIHPEKNR